MNQKILTSTLSVCCLLLIIYIFALHSRSDRILSLALENENLRMNNENLSLKTAIQQFRTSSENKSRNPIGFKKM